MPPSLLVDLNKLDTEKVLYTQQAIYDNFLLQRREFKLLDRIVHFDAERSEILSVVDVRDDAWWVKGHVPGRPMLPGVLMLEIAAQTSNVGVSLQDQARGLPPKRFIVYGGVDLCKFRGAVIPPSVFYLLCVGVKNTARRIVCRTQGVVDGKIVFEARITGLVSR